MTLETAVYSELRSHAGLSALIDDRVYPRQIPQDQQLPAIAYFRASTGDNSTLACGDSDLVTARIQIDVVSESYLEAKSVAKQVRKAMSDASLFKSVKQQDKDMPGMNPDYHSVMLEFNVWFKEV